MWKSTLGLTIYQKRRRGLLRSFCAYCGGELLKARTLAGENSVFKAAYGKLLELISEAEERYNTKLYVDTMYENARSWLSVVVFLHGDRNVINMVAIKMITWQHQNLKAWEKSYLYIYPAEDRERYEEANS